MKMKKKVLATILCLSTLCFLTSCANKPEHANAQKENTKSAAETDTETADRKTDTESIAATEDEAVTDTENGANTNPSNTSISADAAGDNKAETKPQLPEYDSTNFEDIPLVADALNFSITPVESFSNGFEFASFGVDKNDNFTIYYNKTNPDNAAENMGVAFTITAEEYIYDPDWDEARALEDAVIENIPVKVRLYTHYDCEGDWRSLLTEDELNELMALFKTGAAGGGETDLNKEGKIEVKEHYWLRWQQNESCWVCAMSNISKPKYMTLEDLEAVAQEFMQSCTETQPAE